MPLDHADLFFERDDVAGKESELAAALLALPGVKSVAPQPQSGESIEACVRIDFDPQVTNPVIIKDALAGQGFTILSAAERA